VSATEQGFVVAQLRNGEFSEMRRDHASLTSSEAALPLNRGRTGGRASESTRTLAMSARLAEAPSAVEEPLIEIRRTA
jgi:hypothetical protein